jgi:hypothetical protein
MFTQYYCDGGNNGLIGDPSSSHPKPKELKEKYGVPKVFLFSVQSSSPQKSWGSVALAFLEPQRTNLFFQPLSSSSPGPGWPLDFLYLPLFMNSFFFLLS